MALGNFTASKNDESKKILDILIEQEISKNKNHI